jgi:hypothetical protein
MRPSSSDTTGDGHDDPTDLDPEDVEDVEDEQDEQDVEDEQDAEPFDDDGRDEDEGDEDVEPRASRPHDERAPRRFGGRDELDDDGLAPEAGQRRPSLLSLLLLVAGAIWIVVALLKLGEPTGVPMSLAEQAESSAELPDVEESESSDPTNGNSSGNFDGQDPQPAPEVPNSTENGAVVEKPEHAPQPEVGTPASERGPPEGSLLAGKRWPQDHVAPDVVTYTIKRGGSMKTVANLYKIYHHEIEALNPGVSLERELPPSTKIVVYRRKPGVSSQSVGYPGDGSVEGAMPMVDGPGRMLRHTPWKAWATRTTVATIDLVLREWARRYPSEQVIIVGNLSARDGGKLQPHSSHQSGRDVDLSYPQIWDHKSELAPQDMSARNLNRELTWSLLELLRETGAVEAVYIDRKLQQLLYEFALESARYSKKDLENWMEYPSPTGTGSPFIQHVPGHSDHLHVRFKCTPGESRCASREH